MGEDNGVSAIPVDVRLESIVADMTDLVVRWLPDGTRIFVNDAYLRCFALTREEAIGTPFLSLVLDGDRDLIEQKLAALTPERPVAENVHRVLRGDDSVGWQHWVDRAFFDEDGHIVELQSVGRDVTEWREREESLRASEARFRALCTHAPIGIFLDDEHGQGVFVNDRYTEITGLDAEQALQDGWMRSVHPDDRERVDREWREAHAARSPVETTYRFRRADGEERWVDGRAAPVRDEADRLLGFVGTLLDITDEQNARDGLRASEERFRALCEHAPVGFFLNDDQRGCVYLNDACCRITGLTQETGLGDGWRHRLHPADHHDMVSSWRETVRTASKFDMQFRFRHEDGTVRWTRTVAAPTLNADGRPSGRHVGCVIDITERMEAERELNRRLEFEQLLSRLSTDFVGASPDRDRELFERVLAAVAEYAGTACAGMYSFSEDRSTARLEYHCESERVRDRDLFRLTRERLGQSVPIKEMSMKWSWSETLAGRTVVVRNRNEFPSPGGCADLAWLDRRARDRHRANSCIPATWTGAMVQIPLRIEDRIIGCLFITDHTRPADWPGQFVEQMELVARLFAGALHRRMVERRLAEQQSLLAHVGRVAVAGEMAAGLAHEMNQPLYAILNCARAIENTIAAGEGALDRELLADASAEIGRSSERAGEMVRRLREFVQRVAPRSSPCRLSALVDESLALVDHELHLGEVAVDVDVSDSIPDVAADPVQIQQVLVNLVRNAIEAMATEEGEYRITIRSEVDGEFVRTSVTDSGPGFDASLGDPLEAFATTKETGMGIGLAICRSIVQAHGGRLWIDESHAGRVLFTLPVVAAESSGESNP